MKVKSLEEIKQAYREGVAVAPARYSRGVSRTTDWKEKAIAGDGLYKEKVQQAIAQDLHRKALEKTSNADWQSKAAGVGSQRIGPGMTAGVDKQAAAFSPFKAALEATTLPPKTSDPIANLTARGGAVVSAMVAKKKELQGVS